MVRSTTLKKYAADHPDAAGELMRWNKTARNAIWRNFGDVRHHFPAADQYKSLLIFDMRHNYYRLIVKVDYQAKILMIKAFLNHKEYERRGWKKWAH